MAAVVLTGLAFMGSMFQWYEASYSYPLQTGRVTIVCTVAQAVGLTLVAWAALKRVGTDRLAWTAAAVVLGVAGYLVGDHLAQMAA